MRYLTLAANYNEFCVQDDFNGVVDPKELALPSEIIDKLNDWNATYKKIIPLDMSQRKVEDIQKSIAKLDDIGLELVDVLKKCIQCGVKIRYFSEGHLKYLLVPEKV